MHNRSWPKMKPIINVLRPYQEECIQTCVDFFAKSGIRRQIVSLPVGSGKTTVFSNLIHRIPVPSTLPQARKTLVLAHREELINQAYNQIKRSLPPSNHHDDEIKVGMDIATKNADVVNSDIIVASVQSLARSPSPTGNDNNIRLLKYRPSDFKCIIIDEAHHAAASTYQRILNHFQVLDPGNHIFLWGCSATVGRHDFQSLGTVFEKIVYHRSVKEMINEGWLCNAYIKRFQGSYCPSIGTLSDIAISDGDYSMVDIRRKLNLKALNRGIASEWSNHRSALYLKSTLVFAVDIQHAHELMLEFRQVANIEAHAITGKTPSIERQHLLSRFSNREFPVLINCSILTEGTDIPCIDSLVMARPTKSKGLLLQMLGRGLRLFPDKHKTLVMDFVNNFSANDEKYEFPPTLDGLDLDGSIKGGSKPKNGDAEAAEQSLPTPPPMKFLPSEWKEMFNHVFETTIDPSQANFSRFIALSKFPWDQLGDGQANLYLTDSACMQIVIKSPTDYQVSHMKLKKFSLLEEYRLPLHIDDYETAFRAAETYALRHVSYKWLLQTADWRDAPATDAQLKMARKLGINTLFKSKNVDEECLQNLTKGQIHTIINRRLFSRKAKRMIRKNGDDM